MKDKLHLTVLDVWRYFTVEAIYQRIAEKQQTFSKNLLKITSYLYDEPKMFAMMSASEAGKIMDVSETTVIRFCQKLGYSGYRQLQEEVRESMLEKSSLSDFGKQETETESIKDLMEEDAQTIRQAMSRLLEESLATAVSRLAACDRTLVAGLRTSHALASWFAFALDLIMGRTRLYQPTVDDVLLRVGELTEKSVVVVFSFHRYAADTVNLAKLAEKQGAFIIAITDSPAAPVSGYADLVLPIHLNSVSTLDVAPVAMSLAKNIVSAISQKNIEEFQQRVARFDEMASNDFFGR